MTIFVNTYFVMFGNVIREARKGKGLNLNRLSAQTGIDQTLISRIENGNRLPTEQQLKIFAEHLSIDLNLLRKEWMTEKVLQIVKYSPIAHEVLAVAESRIEYLSTSNRFQVPAVSEKMVTQLDRIDKLKDKWQAKLPLDTTQKERLEEYFDVSYTFESNRIEGNTLTLQETKLVGIEGLTIGGKSLHEHLEAVNHLEAISFIRDLATNKEPISKRVLLEIHRLVLKELDSSNAGRFRSVPVMISGSEHKPPQPYLLDKLMEDFFEFYNYQQTQLHPILLAAELHERLVSIHPFIDGNGRTARLLMNLVLVRSGFTRANIKGDMKNRMDYYKALENVQVNNSRQDFYQLVIDESEKSLIEHLELV